MFCILRQIKKRNKGYGSYLLNWFTENNQKRDIFVNIEEVYDEVMINTSDFPEQYFKAKYIHIATNFPYMQKEFIDMIRRKSDAIISIDTHEAYMEKESDFIKEIFDSVDIAFIDKEYTKLLDCKAPIKIIKMGKDGCKYIDKNKSFIVNAEVNEVIEKQVLVILLLEYLFQ